MSDDPEPRVPEPRPIFHHRDNGHGPTSGFPQPVLLMNGILGMLVAAGPLSAIVFGRVLEPGPARTALIAAALAVAGFAFIGLCQILDRRNGGRALACLLSLALLVGGMVLVGSGTMGIDEDEPLESFLGLTSLLAILVAGAVQPFRREGREWLAKPLGHYEDEGDELRTQIPFPLALALSGLWIAIAAIVIGATVLLADTRPLTNAGLVPADLPVARVVLWTLLGWSAVQSLLCLLLACRNDIARRLTAWSALLAAPASAVLGWLLRQWTGSVATGAATAALLTAAGLTCWIMTTLPTSTAWCTKPST